MKRYTDPSSLRKHLRAHRRQLTHSATGSCRMAPSAAAARRRNDSMTRSSNYSQKQQQRLNVSACSNNNCCPSEQPHYAAAPAADHHQQQQQQHRTTTFDCESSSLNEQQDNICFQAQQMLPAADYDPSVVLEEFVVHQTGEQQFENELVLKDCVAHENLDYKQLEEEEQQQQPQPANNWRPTIAAPAVARPVASVQQQHRWRQHHAQLSRSWCAGSAGSAGPTADSSFWPSQNSGGGQWDDQLNCANFGSHHDQVNNNNNNSWQTNNQPNAQQQQQQQFRQHEQLMRSMPASNYLL